MVANDTNTSNYVASTCNILIDLISTKNVVANDTNTSNYVESTSNILVRRIIDSSSNLQVNGTISATGLITGNAGLTASTMTASGLITANGGITIPAGKLLNANGGITIPAGQMLNANGGITIPSGQTLTMNSAYLATGTMTTSGLYTANGGITLGTASLLTANGGITIPAGKLLNANGGITIPSGQTLTSAGTLTASTINASGLITATNATTGTSDSLIMQYDTRNGIKFQQRYIGVDDVRYDLIQKIANVNMTTCLTFYNGNVGIGTITPVSKLHLYNNTTTTTFTIQNESTKFITSSPSATATGITEEYIYLVYEYTTETGGTNSKQTLYNINVPASITCDILMVGGGGHGGKELGGGGGGGAVLYGTNINISSNIYTIYVGNGGIPDTSTTRGASTIGFGATILGGGNAANVALYTDYSITNNGGSGAGGKSSMFLPATSTQNGGSSNLSTKGTLLTTATLYHGNKGGQGTTTRTYGMQSAGGGGASNVGGNGNGMNESTGNGGWGVLVNITGSNYYWGGGGGGGSWNTTANPTNFGNGGLGGGGAGGASSEYSTAAEVLGIVGGSCYKLPVGKNGGSGTGGGGGGAGASAYNGQKGGNGGSGIVIIRYKEPTTTSSIEFVGGTTSDSKNDWYIGNYNGTFKIISSVSGLPTDILTMNSSGQLSGLASVNLANYWTKDAGTNIYLNQTGNVGIGTSTNLTNKLHVEGTMSTSGLITGNAGLTIPSGQTLTSSGTLTANIINASGLITGNAGLTIPSGQTLTSSGTLTANIINASGTLTANIINASGPITVTNTAVVTSNILTMQYNIQNGIRFSQRYVGVNDVRYDLIQKVANVDKTASLTLYNGNVGIGTITPSNNLHIYRADNNIPSFTTQNYITTTTTTTITSTPAITSIDISGTIYKLMTFVYTSDTGLYPGQTHYIIDVPANGYICDILVIGGGGGGIDIYYAGSGYDYPGGGGGAGALIYYKNFVLSAGTYYILVGKGGNNDGSSGTASRIYTANNILINASGGGGGGRWLTQTPITYKNADNGGSGGGTGYECTPGVAVSTLNKPTLVYGYNGGVGSIGTGGGGGGAGGPGGSGIDSVSGGAGAGGTGGIGLEINITGTNKFYAGGGGGGGGNGASFLNYGGTGGSSVGGNGGYNKSGTRYAGSGLANTGSGGGGGGGAPGAGFTGTAGAGGSGVVIIRYKVSEGNPELQLVSGSTITNGQINKIGIYNGIFQIKTFIDNKYEDEFSLTLKNGNLGIGTTNPSYKLQIKGNVYNEGIYSNGNVGIGVVENATIRLDVGTGTGSSGAVNARYFNYDTTTVGSFTFTDVCARFGSTIWVQSWVAASSDKRIKEDIEDINDDSALNIILAIEPKKYKYIDKIAKGDKKVYGFIAQQIREVLPDAVNLQREYIPNIMLLADYNDNVITLSSRPSYIIKINDKIKCYDINIKNVYVEVIEIIDEITFRVKPLEYTDTKIFVYGVEIDDFHTISKEYIFTLNVCATQELHKRMEAQQVIIQSQEDRIKELETKMTQILNNMSQ